MLLLWWAEQGLSSGENLTLTKHCPAAFRPWCPVFQSSQECESFLRAHCSLGLFGPLSAWPVVVLWTLPFSLFFL